MSFCAFVTLSDIDIHWVKFHCFSKTNCYLLKVCSVLHQFCKFKMQCQYEIKAFYETTKDEYNIDLF